jgi:transposase-like protein
LVITDGVKGLQAAGREVFGAAALLRRSQWHRRENVVRYLPERLQTTFRRKLQAAYERPTYERAGSALSRVRCEFVLINGSAVASLDEGVEEALTLRRLGLVKPLGISLKTTNILESINARVGSRIDKVDHWHTSDQMAMRRGLWLAG